MAKDDTAPKETTAPKQVQVFVEHQFTLNRKNERGEAVQTVFYKGIQMVDEEVANHTYAKNFFGEANAKPAETIKDDGPGLPTPPPPNVPGANVNQAPQPPK